MWDWLELEMSPTGGPSTPGPSESLAAHEVMLAKPKRQNVSHAPALLGFWPFLPILAGPWVYL